VSNSKNKFAPYHLHHLLTIFTLHHPPLEFGMYCQGGVVQDENCQGGAGGMVQFFFLEFDTFKKNSI
jgi:hypothetical protein